MSVMTRAVVMIAATVVSAGCKPREEAAQEPATESTPAETTAAAAPALLDACHIKMAAPEAHEWTSKWDTAHTRTVSAHPSGVRAMAWEDATEKKANQQYGAKSAIDIVCGNGDAAGDQEFTIALNAFDSSEQDIPMAPGTYPIVAKSPDGKMKPGTLIAGTILYGTSMFTATAGTLTIDRFDMNGVAGSFVVDGHEILMGSRPLHVEVTFDMPCRGRLLQSACTANKEVD